LPTDKKKNVLITGAGRGIGKRLAIGFARDGARVGLLSRSKAELELTQLEIEHAGGSAVRLRGDVCIYREARSAADRMRAHYGEIDVLVCAAGIQGPIGPAWKVSPKAWATTIETNLTGVYNACRTVLPAMVERRSGKIVVLAGGGSMRSRPNFSGYAASKAGVARLVETIAEEVLDYNVQVNCMGPGTTYTHMTDLVLKAGAQAGEKDLEEAMQVRMTGGTAPEKQIELALFLASEHSNHITGKLIHVSDDWQRLRDADVHREQYTLRRIRRI
jgi:3-oxoacyl-[acyl-carrier protein] reductase